MADPRFFDNRGPFTLAEVCACIGASCPDGAAESLVYDLAALEGASGAQLTFFAPGKTTDTAAFTQTEAGFCLVPTKIGSHIAVPQKTVCIPCASVHHAWAAIALKFYPESSLGTWPQAVHIHPTAKIGEGVELAPGVTLGPNVEIGDRTRIGPNTVIGRGVAIGRGCEIGANVSIQYAYVGDAVTILPGSQIGQTGFGFANAPTGHTKIPQLGRVIVQSRVEIGANATIDRGALIDTVIGEGTKIDNLVQIGHNVRIGRHCIIVSQCGISGSSVLGDFVVFGGQVGIADHCTIGSGARLAGRTATTTGQTLEGERDYAGVPAKSLMDWIRELYAVAALIKKQNESTMTDTASQDVSLDVEAIKKLLPHRAPILLVERLYDIVPFKSATGRKAIGYNEPWFQGHFPAQAVMPGVLIVEAMAQTSGALVMHSLGQAAGTSVVYFMTIEKARFRKPVSPGDMMVMKVDCLRRRDPVFRFSGKAYVDDVLVAEAEFSAMIQVPAKG